MHAMNDVAQETMHANNENICDPDIAPKSPKHFEPESEEYLMINDESEKETEKSEKAVEIPNQSVRDRISLIESASGKKSSVKPPESLLRARESAESQAAMRNSALEEELMEEERVFEICDWVGVAHRDEEEIKDDVLDQSSEKSIGKSDCEQLIDEIVGQVERIKILSPKKRTLEEIEADNLVKEDIGHRVMTQNVAASTVSEAKMVIEETDLCTETSSPFTNDSDVVVTTYAINEIADPIVNDIKVKSVDDRDIETAELFQGDTKAEDSLSRTAFPDQKETSVLNCNDADVAGLYQRNWKIEVSAMETVMPDLKRMDVEGSDSKLTDQKGISVSDCKNTDIAVQMRDEILESKIRVPEQNEISTFDLNDTETVVPDRKGMEEEDPVIETVAPDQQRNSVFDSRNSDTVLSDQQDTRIKSLEHEAVISTIFTMDSYFPKESKQDIIGTDTSPKQLETTAESVNTLSQQAKQFTEPTETHFQNIPEHDHRLSIANFSLLSSNPSHDQEPILSPTIIKPKSRSQSIATSSSSIEKMNSSAAPAQSDPIAEAQTQCLVRRPKQRHAFVKWMRAFPKSLFQKIRFKKRHSI